MKQVESNKTLQLISAIVVAALLIAFSFLYSGLLPKTQRVEASTQVPVNGWLWSDNFGWIAASCKNGGPTGNNICASNNFGLTVDSMTGILSGYAWSDNVGWISANSADLSGCPIAPCSATINGTSVSGWLKVISGGGSQNGGWDGFISLNGTGYGVTYNNSGNFGGYAWEGDGATQNGVQEMDGTTANGVQVRGEGWISFALASSTYNTCTPSTVYTCNGPQTIVQTVTDSSCNVSVINTACITPRFCSTGVPSCVTPPATDYPTGNTTGHLTAKPNLVPKNATTTLYWGIVNVTGCSVTNNANSTVWNGAFSATSSCATKYQGGCQTPPITQQTIYTLTCTDFNSLPYTETATVNVLPDFQER